MAKPRVVAQYWTVRFMLRGCCRQERVTVNLQVRLGSTWLCCRWRYEVLFVQVLLRAGKEGRVQGAWRERSLLLLKQLQCKKPGFKSHHLRELLLSPRLHVAVAPVVEADMRGGEKEYPEATSPPS